jgi:hypothetical protein
VGGKKQVLAERLKDDNVGSAPLQQIKNPTISMSSATWSPQGPKESTTMQPTQSMPASPHTPLLVPLTTLQAPPSTSQLSQGNEHIAMDEEGLALLPDEELKTALRDLDSLEHVYQQAIDGDDDDDEQEEVDDDDNNKNKNKNKNGGKGKDKNKNKGNEDEDEGEDNECAGVDGDNEDEDMMAWADGYILATRRKGGQQTETSVLQTYTVDHSNSWLLQVTTLMLVNDRNGFWELSKTSSCLMPSLMQTS